ncbi:uncharacterized protein VTP21DRAFT_1178 [Calcarisporiella thermophila]|uniref:uncharacterized protein n=1 Tax=Calcarisporiella thermophila TaxID=911321 RepID=UPI003742F67E
MIPSTSVTPPSNTSSYRGRSAGISSRYPIQSASSQAAHPAVPSASTSQDIVRSTTPRVHSQEIKEEMRLVSKEFAARRAAITSALSLESAENKSSIHASNPRSSVVFSNASRVSANGSHLESKRLSKINIPPVMKTNASSPHSLIPPTTAGAQQSTKSHSPPSTSTSTQSSSHSVNVNQNSDNTTIPPSPTSEIVRSTSPHARIEEVKEEIRMAAKEFAARKSAIANALTQDAVMQNSTPHTPLSRPTSVYSTLSDSSALQHDPVPPVVEKPNPPSINGTLRKKPPPPRPSSLSKPPSVLNVSAPSTPTTSSSQPTAPELANQTPQEPISNHAVAPTEPLPKDSLPTASQSDATPLSSSTRTSTSDEPTLIRRTPDRPFRLSPLLFGRRTPSSASLSSLGKLAEDEAVVIEPTTTNGAAAEGFQISLPVTEVPGEFDRKRKRKRQNVIMELVDTEAAFLNDMVILKELYYDQAAEQRVLSNRDIKKIFSNLSEIVRQASNFLELLRAATGYNGRSPPLLSPMHTGSETGASGNDSDSLPDLGMDEERTWIGEAFLNSMSQIEEVYCEYCKHHETAILRLQEVEKDPSVATFFQACKEQMAGRTTSWDLSSLLIKPVQRVLKYPLLLMQIVKLTPPTHSDYDNLNLATKEIQNVADRINEIKKRKDIVERIVGSRRKTDADIVHGINKTITRRAQQFRYTVGLQEVTVDAFYNALVEKFEYQQNQIRQLARDLQTWLRFVKEYLEVAEQYSMVLEDFYILEPGKNNSEQHAKSVERVREYRRCVTGITTGSGRDLDTAIKTIIFPTLDALLNLYKSPIQVMRKREKKLLDYDRVQAIRAKGEKVDRNLKESADAYLSIHAQLLEELPRFLALTTEYYDAVVGEIARIQSKFYKDMASRLESRLGNADMLMPLRGLEETIEFADIAREYGEKIYEVDEYLAGISVLQRRGSVSGSGISSLYEWRSSSPMVNAADWSLGGERVLRRQNTASSVATSLSDSSGFGLNGELGERNYPSLRRTSSQTSSTLAPTPTPSVLTNGAGNGDNEWERMVPGALFRCRANFPYDRTGDTELDLEVGAIMDVIHVHEDTTGAGGDKSSDESAWWYGMRVNGTRAGECGWFPAGFCSRL